MRYVTQMPPSGLRPSGQVKHLVPELKKESKKTSFGWLRVNFSCELKHPRSFRKKDILRVAPRQLQLRHFL